VAEAGHVQAERHTSEVVAAASTSAAAPRQPCPHAAAHRRARTPATPRASASWRAELCEWVDFQNEYALVHKGKPTEPT